MLTLLSSCTTTPTPQAIDLDLHYPVADLTNVEGIDDLGSDCDRTDESELEEDESTLKC